MTSKEKYALLDKLNMCHRCEKAPQEIGKYCFGCVEKNRDYNRSHYNSEKAKEYQARRREIYLQKKKDGICVRCSKNATHGIYCYEHSIYAKRNNRNMSEKRKLERHDRGLVTAYRLENGLCLRCGDTALPDEKYCKRCKNNLILQLNEAREKSPYFNRKFYFGRNSNGQMGNY